MEGVKELKRKLAEMQETVGKDRDKLDQIISDAEGLKESCRKAWDALQDARDALSELV